MGNDYITNAIAGTPVGGASVPQSKPVSPKQKKNSAGGFSFEVSPMTRFRRWLFLGSETGSYYSGNTDLTNQNIDNIVKMIQTGYATEILNTIEEVSLGGLALRQDQTLFSLALVMKYGNESERNHARNLISKIARTGTMLFQTTDYLKSLGKTTGGALSKGLASWFYTREPGQIAYQMAKYSSRKGSGTNAAAGWTYEDILRIAHPKPQSEQQAAVFAYALGKITATELEDAIGPNHLSGKARAHQAKNVKDLMKIVSEYRLTWEMIPTQYLNDPVVWDYLIPNTGYTALVRNLSRLTNNGWLKPASENRRLMMDLLTDGESITKSRIHPFAIYIASRTYGSGRSKVRSGWGSRNQKMNTWTPVNGITDALDDAFTKAFGNIEPSGLRRLEAMDVSGSMGVEVLPGVSAMEASAVMLLIALRTEPNIEVVAFSSDSRTGWHRNTDVDDVSNLTHVELSTKSTLNSVTKEMNRLSHYMSGTDCSLPMRWANAKGYEFDAFTLYTDSETWAGPEHPHLSLEKYRRKTGINAKSAVVAMVPNSKSVANPDDPGMLDVIGLDANLPRVLTGFYSGQF